MQCTLGNWPGHGGKLWQATHHPGLSLYCLQTALTELTDPAELGPIPQACFEEHSQQSNEVMYKANGLLPSTSCIAHCACHGENGHDCRMLLKLVRSCTWFMLGPTQYGGSMVGSHRLNVPAIDNSSH